MDLKKIRLSPSSINSFYYCQKKWYKTYVEKIRGKDSIHTIRGKAVHHACEHLFDADFVKSLPWTIGEALPILKAKAQELFKTEWETYNETLSALELSMDEKNTYYTTSANAINLFVERKVGDAMMFIDKGKVKRFNTAFKRVSPKFRELWVEDKEINSGGFIDAVQHDSYSDSIALIDYKTSMPHGEMLTVDYRRQLAIYALLYWKQQKVKAKYVGIHYLMNNSTILLEVTDELIQFAEDTINDVRNQIGDKGTDIENYSDTCRFKRTDGKWVEYKWNGIM